jgi:hypothetical protein
MPSKREILRVISIFIIENKLHPKMRKYIMTVLERGKTAEYLEAMTKEEVWGLVAFFAKALQGTIQHLGGLQ